MCDVRASLVRIMQDRNTKGVSRRLDSTRVLSLDYIRSLETSSLNGVLRTIIIYKTVLLHDNSNPGDYITYKQFPEAQ